VAQVLGMLLLGVAVAGIATALRLLGLRTLPCVLGALALTFAPWRGIASAGVEGALALALLCWFFVALLKVLLGQTRRSMVIAGLLAALTILARLDTIMVVGSMLLFALLGPLKPVLGRRGSRRDLVLLLGPPVVLVGCYLLVNLALTGNPMPITASLKSSFPKPHFSFGFLFSNVQYYIAIAVAWAATLLYRRGPERALLAGLTVGATVFGGYVALFGRGVFWWYFVSLVPAGAVGAGITLDWLLDRLKSRVLLRRVEIVSVVLAAGIILIPLVWSIIEKYPNGDYVANTGWRIEAERAGHWASKRLPPHALLAMKDSGAFGFYTKQPLMNLDGVISNRSFNDALCNGTAFDEMINSGVSYVAYQAVRSDYTTFTIGLPCWEHGTTPTRLTFLRRDEVYRGSPYWHGGRNEVFVIWRFDPIAMNEREAASGN
jgi:hypothetical protein